MRTPTPSVEHTSHIFSRSPLIFTQCASALSLMRLRSTRECMRSASALKAATRRLSCTTWACNRLRRSAASGAWRMASMCWQVCAPGAGTPAPAAHSQPPCARLVAAQRRRLDRKHRHHRQHVAAALSVAASRSFRRLCALLTAARLLPVATRRPRGRPAASRRRLWRLWQRAAIFSV